MNVDKAKYVIAEIKSIPRYEKIIANLDEKMMDIAARIETIQSPSCSLGHIGPGSATPKSKVSVINELLSDESRLLKEQDEFKAMKRRAEKYRALVFVQCESDAEFLKEFFEGKPYGILGRKYCVSNVYRKVVSLISGIQDKF